MINTSDEFFTGIAKEVTRQSVDALLEDSGSDYVPSSSSSSSDVSEDEEDKDSEESSDGYEVSGVIPLDKATEPEQLIKRKRRAAINHFVNINMILFLVE